MKSVKIFVEQRKETNPKFFQKFAKNGVTLSGTSTDTLGIKSALAPQVLVESDMNPTLCSKSVAGPNGQSEVVVESNWELHQYLRS